MLSLSSHRPKAGGRSISQKPGRSTVGLRRQYVVARMRNASVTQDVVSDQRKKIGLFIRCQFDSALS